MIRATWDWLNRTVQRIAPEGTFLWDLATWLGHGTVAAACVGLVAPLLLVGLDLRVYAACAAGGYYGIRELEQVFLSRSHAPWWDHAMDVASPWIVGLWLAGVVP